MSLIGGMGRTGSGNSSTNELRQCCQDGGPIRMSQYNTNICVLITRYTCVLQVRDGGSSGLKHFKKRLKGRGLTP